jgi:chromosome segregation ATPase
MTEIEQLRVELEDAKTVASGAKARLRDAQNDIESYRIWMRDRDLRIEALERELCRLYDAMHGDDQERRDGLERARKRLESWGML